MSVSSSFEPQKTLVVCTPDTTMSEMALCCQLAFGWHLGHGQYRFKVERQWKEGQKDNGLYLFWTTDLAPKPLEFSLIASFRDLRKENYLPQKLSDEELWKPPSGANEFKIVMGQQRVSSIKDQSLIQGRNIPSNQLILQEAFAMADMAVTFFIAGATVMEYQVSLDMVQVRFDREFPGATIRKWLNPDVNQPTYRPQDKVTRIK